MTGYFNYRKSHIVKYIFCAGCLYVLTTAFIGLFTSARNGNSITNVFDRIPAEWQDFCQFLELSVSGEEGTLNKSDLKLRGITITFRHGERSALTNDSDLSGCKPYREEDRQKFESYRHKILSDDFKYFLKTDKKLASFPKLPLRAECIGGQMTAEGALQLVRLGEFLKKRYDETFLFNPDSYLNVTIQSSLYNRTFQSGVAFASSFIYPMKYKIPQLFYKSSEFNSLCTHEACKCPQEYRLMHEKELLDNFLITGPPHMRELMGFLRELPSYISAAEPLQVLDVSLGRYICRRKHLPCIDDKCLSFDFLNDLLNYTTLRADTLFGAGDAYISQRLQLIEAYGNLFHIREMMNKMKTFPHTNFIKIFSGHDTTVGPLVKVLGVPLIDPPHYASRAVFEFYERESTGELLFKLLYNGLDVTKHIHFCSILSSEGLCPVVYLDTFVKIDIIKKLGGKTVPEFCRNPFMPLRV